MTTQGQAWTTNRPVESDERTDCYGDRLVISISLFMLMIEYDGLNRASRLGRPLWNTKYDRDLDLVMCPDRVPLNQWSDRQALLTSAKVTLRPSLFADCSSRSVGIFLFGLKHDRQGSDFVFFLFFPPWTISR